MKHLANSLPLSCLKASMNMKMAFGAKVIWSGSSATCAEHNALPVEWADVCMYEGLLFGNRKWGCDLDCPSILLL